MLILQFDIRAEDDEYIDYRMPLSITCMESLKYCFQYDNKELWVILINLG